MVAVQVAGLVPHSQQVSLIDQSDPNSISFSDGWSITSYSSAIGGSYAFASEPSARVNITLPLGTVAVRYAGFRLQTSTTYGFCVDCTTDDLSNATCVQVDGAPLNAGGDVSPFLLFAVEKLDPMVSHVITVFNPRPQNLITIDAVMIDMLADTAVPLNPTVSTPTPMSSPMSSSNPSPTTSLTLPPAPRSSTSADYPITSTLASPSATSQGSGSGGISEGVSVPLIIALTVSSVIILTMILIVYRCVRRPRQEDAVLGSESKGSNDPGPHGPPVLVLRSRSGSTESNVLPTPVSWSTLSPTAGSASGRLSITALARLNSRHARTPSMMETLESHTDSSGSVPGDGHDYWDHPQSPQDVV